MAPTLSFIALLLACSAPTSLAFPKLSNEALAHLSVLQQAVPKEKRAVTFDPKAQLVDVTGAHAWKAPNFAAGDQRGPCPGLNSLANHGYLPRSGVTPWTTIAKMTNQVFGLGADIAGFLAFYGAVFDGNILSLDPGYSIGGPSAKNQQILGGGGILGTPQGLSGSHNKYESDASSGRYDLYTGGNDYKVDLVRYRALYNLGEPYTLDTFKIHRKNMFLKSVNENPYFFNAPFAGVIASTGGFTFPPRLMSNKSAEYPDNGYLSKSTLNSFWSITGNDSDSLVYTYGHERIPDNFYRRAIGNEYTGALFFEDALNYAQYFPEMISIGGNTGKTNSYAAVNLGNITGGAYEATTLLQGDNLKCFVFQAIISSAPDVLKGGYSNITGVMTTLTDQVEHFLGDAVCPQINVPLNSQFDQYPGVQKSGDAV